MGRAPSGQQSERASSSWAERRASDAPTRRCSALRACAPPVSPIPLAFADSREPSDTSRRLASQDGGSFVACSGLPKRSPARAWGITRYGFSSPPDLSARTRYGFSSAAPRTSQRAPRPNSRRLLHLSARPRPTSQQPSQRPAQPRHAPVGACSSCDDRRSEPDRRASIFLLGRAPSGQQSERASSSWAERRADNRASEHLPLGPSAERVMPPLVGARRFAPARRRSPPNACSGCQSAALRVRGGDNGTRYGFRSVCCHDLPGRAHSKRATTSQLASAQPRNNSKLAPAPTPNHLSARPRPASQQPPSSTPRQLPTTSPLAPPSLATTSVGDGSSVDDRRSEPRRRASIWNSWAERRADKHCPARAWGRQWNALRIPQRLLPRPPRSSPFQARNHLSARPRPASQQPPSSPPRQLPTTSPLAPAQPRNNLGRRRFLRRRPAQRA